MKHGQYSKYGWYQPAHLGNAKELDGGPSTIQYTLFCLNLLEADIVPRLIEVA